MTGSGRCRRRIAATDGIVDRPAAVVPDRGTGGDDHLWLRVVAGTRFWGRCSPQTGRPTVVQPSGARSIAVVRICWTFVVFIVNDKSTSVLRLRAIVTARATSSTRLGGRKATAGENLRIAQLVLSGALVGHHRAAIGV